MTRLALVTGGAQGIGWGIATRLLAAGWRVAILDVDPEALAERAAERPNEPLLTLAADVGRADEVAAAFARLADWQAADGQPPGLDLLVNNAGIADPVSGPIERLRLADWRRWQDSHLTGAFLCTRAAVPGLRLRRGIPPGASASRMTSRPWCCSWPGRRRDSLPGRR